MEGARECDPGSRRDIGGLRERPAGAPGRNGGPYLLLHIDSLDALFCHFGDTFLYFITPLALKNVDADSLQVYIPQCFQVNHRDLRASQ